MKSSKNKEEKELHTKKTSVSKNPESAYSELSIVDP